MNAPPTLASTVSCSSYAARLAISSRYRLSVLASGWFLFWLGTLLVLHTPTSWCLRVPLVCGWAVLCAREIAGHAAAYRRISRITMRTDGRLVVRRRDGAVEQAELAGGSRLFCGLAWLRIRFADGRIYGECIGAKVAGPENWRRFNSLWRYARRTK